MIRRISVRSFWPTAVGLCAAVLYGPPGAVHAQTGHTDAAALDSRDSSTVARDAPEAGAVDQGAPAPYSLHPRWRWYNPYGPCEGAYYRVTVGPRTLGRSFGHARQTERYRQNVAELRQRLQHGLAHRYAPWSSYPVVLPDPGPPVFTRRDRERYPSPIREFYDQGSRLEYWRQQELATRESLTLLSFDNLFRRGMDAFREGNYGQAARLFVAAADKNHEDAASRLHAAQALLAVGQYAEALRHVRRAFELQPLLMQLPLDLQDDYTIKSDYDAHVGGLAEHVQANPRDHSALLLLGYAQFFGPRPESAASTMAEIKRLAPKDPFARKLRAAAAPIIPEAR
jgi:tetratricopeptide (TPR) repeat protein